MQENKHGGYRNGAFTSYLDGPVSRVQKSGKSVFMWKQYGSKEVTIKVPFQVI